jgi:hypothetical protein
VSARSILDRLLQHWVYSIATGTKEGSQQELKLAEAETPGRPGQRRGNPKKGIFAQLLEKVKRASSYEGRMN